MAKYSVGDNLQHAHSSDSVNMTIIFVPPINGYGVQQYLCTVLNGHLDGGKKMVLSLITEDYIDSYFMIRTQPFKWEG